MIIDKRVHRLLGLGGTSDADVFEVEGKAYKLFRSRPEIPPYRMKEGRERRFYCQVDAYRKIQYGDPWLLAHTAAFYGCYSIEDVIGIDGKSEKEDYLLDCCYAMEMLDLGEKDQLTGLCRNERKLKGFPLSHGGAGYPEELKHLREAVDRFRALGIYVYDASIFFADDPERFTFIDFDSADYYTEN